MNDLTKITDIMTHEDFAITVAEEGIRAHIPAGYELTDDEEQVVLSVGYIMQAQAWLSLEDVLKNLHATLVNSNTTEIYAPIAEVLSTLYVSDADNLNEFGISVLTNKEHPLTPRSHEAMISLIDGRSTDEDIQVLKAGMSADKLDLYNVISNGGIHGTVTDADRARFYL